MMLPTYKWTLPQLAKFCVTTLRRSAEDAHYIGTALSLAREKHTDERKWLTWLKTHIQVSRATAYRYIEIAERLELKECKGLPLKEVYSVIAGLKQPKGEDSSEEVEEHPEAEPSHVETTDDLAKHADAKADKLGPNSSHPEKLSWIVPEENVDTRFAEEAATFIAVLTNFLGDDPTTFMKPTERRKLASQLVEIENLLRQVKAAMAVGTGQRAA